MIQYIIIILIVCILYYVLHNKIKVYNEKQEYYTYKDTPTVIPHFITKDEADYIKENSKTFVKSDIVLDDKNDDKYSGRISETCWIEHMNDEKLKNIVHRACKLTRMPYENCELLQVVKYGKGGYYAPHYDTTYNTNTNNAYQNLFYNRGGHRLITIIIALCNPDEYNGGETYFTKINKNYKINKGDALLFYNVTPNGELNILSEHTGKPLQSGQKMISNIWIRESQFTR